MILDNSEKSLVQMKDLFGDKGWILLKDVFDTEGIEKLRGFLNEQRLEMDATFSKYVHDAEYDIDRDYSKYQKKLRKFEENPEFPPDLGHYLRGEFDLQTRLSREVMEPLSSNTFQREVHDLIGSNFLAHYPPMIRFKVADAQGSVLPAHQDAPYSKHLSDFITTWVPLVKIDQEVGGLIMFNGSHHNSAEDPEFGNDFWEYAKNLDSKNFDKERVLMEQGDALVFPSTLIHASALQLSKKIIRYSIDFRIFRDKEDTDKSYYDPLTESVSRNH